MPANSWLRSFSGYLWGYDFFISYHWLSGGRYAVALAEALRTRGHECFLDRSEFAIGDDWKFEAHLALRRTQRLIVVATTEAVSTSEAVKHELEEFQARRRQVFLVVFGKHFDENDRVECCALQLIPADSLNLVETMDAAEGKPSKTVVDEIVRSYGVLRRRKLRARWIGGVMCALVTLLIVSLLQTWRAKLQTRRANQELSHVYLERSEAQRLQRNTVEAEAFLAAALSVDDQDNVRARALESLANGVSLVWRSSARVASEPVTDEHTAAVGPRSGSGGGSPLAEGPAGPIDGLASSPDGKLVGLRGYNEVWVLDSQTGRAVGRANDDLGGLPMRPFFTAGGRIGVRLQRAQGIAPKVFAPTAPILELVPDPVLGSAEELFDFDRQTGELLTATYEGGLVHVGRKHFEGIPSRWHDGIGRRFAVDPSGRNLALITEQVLLQSGEDGPAVALDASRGATAVTFTPNGEILAATDGAKIVAWRVSDRSKIVERTFAASIDGAHDDVLAIDPSGTRAVTSSPKAVFVWRLADGTLLHRFDFESRPMHRPSAAAFGSDNASLFIGFRDGGVERWLLGRSSAATGISVASAWGLGFTFAPNGHSLAAIVDGRIGLWSDKGEALAFAFPQVELQAAAWLHTELFAVTSNRSSGCIQFGPFDQKWHSESFSPGTAPVFPTQLVASDNGKVVALATVLDQSVQRDRHAIEIWDTGTMKIRARRSGTCADITRCDNPIGAMDFHPSKPWLAYGGLDNVPRVWDFEIDRDVVSLPPQREVIAAVRFLNDGRLITASSDGELRTWSSDFQAHEAVQLGKVVAMGRSGAVVSQDKDGLLVRAGREALAPLRLRGMVGPAAFSRDESFLVTTTVPWEDVPSNQQPGGAFVIWNLAEARHLIEAPPDVLASLLLQRSDHALRDVRPDPP
jgi:WD40 repeat protein